MFTNAEDFKQFTNLIGTFSYECLYFERIPYLFYLNTFNSYSCNRSDFPLKPGIRRNILLKRVIRKRGFICALCSGVLISSLNCNILAVNSMCISFLDFIAGVTILQKLSHSSFYQIIDKLLPV